MRKWLLVFFAATFLFSCNNYLRLRRKAAVVQNQFLAETDFDFSAKLIVIQVEIRGQTYPFIFDTGAHNSVISKTLADQMNLMKKGELKINDSRENSQMLDLVVLDTVSIAGIDFTKITANAMDFGEFSALNCLSFGGIIGNNLIQKCQWKIDFEREKMTLSDGDLATPAMNFVEMKYPESRPNVALKVDTVHFHKVLFDTGSRGGLDLDISEEKMAAVGFDQHPSVTVLDGATEGLFGAKLDTLVRFRADSVVIGKFSLANPVVDIEEDKGSKLGSQVYAHGILYLDYQNARIGFQSYKEPSIASDSLFFRAIPSLSADGLSVALVVLDRENPVQIGAKIHRLNGKKAADFPQYCDFFAFMDEQSRSNGHFEITLEGDTTKTYIIEKENLWRD